MTKEELLEELKKHKITKEELVKIMVGNFTKPLGFVQAGILDLSELDFSSYDMSINISKMKVKKSLYQNYQAVGKNLYQNYQTVVGCLYQSNQEVIENIWQDNQKARCYFLQDTKDLVKKDHCYMNKPTLKQRVEQLNIEEDLKNELLEMIKEKTNE